MTDQTFFTLYEKRTGRATMTIFCSQEDAMEHESAQVGVEEGRFPVDDSYWDNGFKQLPPKPADGSHHQFNYESKKWEFDRKKYIDDALHRRNLLLSLSDWTQSPDSPLLNKQEWAQYRQALRDITDQDGYPSNINWPQEP